MSELSKIALQILSKGKGILAADESTATMTKRLDSAKVQSNENNRLLFENNIRKIKLVIAFFSIGFPFFHRTLSSSY